MFLSFEQIEGNFLFDSASHGDFLGAALGTGIVRETLGDIVVQGDTGAIIFTTPEVSKHLEALLMRVIPHDSSSTKGI